MRKWGIAAGVAVVLLCALLFMRPYATRDREVISSTPAAASLFQPPQPIELKKGELLCVVNVPLDTDSELARIFVYTFGKPGAPLQVEALGKGYKFQGRLPGGYPEGPVELALKPPAKPLDGQVCVRNQGPGKVAVKATQVGQRFSRPQPYKNGFGLEQDVPMTIHERGAKTLIAQTPRAIDHAAVFVPLAPWAIWIVLALVLLGIPFAVFFALARADASPAGIAIEPGSAAPPVPLRRARRWLWRGGERVVAWGRRLPPGAWLALLILAVLAFGYLWASRMGTFQNDEAQNAYFARWMANNLPGSLWNFSMLERGFQRAEIYLLALTLGSFKTSTALLLAHFVNVAAWVSAAVPAYLLLRGMGARAVWALLAALLTITGPWLVFSSSFLTEPLAYPAFVWLMWAIFRAAVDPRPVTELVALALLFVALLTRSAFLILIPVLPIVVFLQELRFGGLRGGARAIAARMWSRHAVLVVLCGIGVLALLASQVGAIPSPKKLAGAYGTPSVIWGPFLDKTALYASRVVVGTGFLPFAVGLPWIVAQLFRPDDERTHAFVVTAALMIVLVAYASSPAGPDERYVIYFGAPLIVAAVAAIARGRLAWPWVAAGGVLGAVLIYKHGWNPEGGAYGFFIGPGETFYARVGLLHLQDYVPQGLSLYKGALLVALGATAVLAYAFMRRSASRVVLLTLVAGLAVLQVAQASYTTSKFVTQGGERFGRSHKERAWIDETIYGKGTAALLGLGPANTPAFNAIWAETQFWNTSVDSEFAFSQLLIQLPPGDTPGLLTLDGVTGAVKSDPAVPAYAVVPNGYVGIGVAGTPVAHSSYLPLDLIKLERPLRVTFQVSEIEPDGFVLPRQKTSIRFFAGGRDAGKCGTVSLSVPGDPSAGAQTIRYRLGSRAGSVRTGQTVNERVPLAFNGRPYLDVPLRSNGRVSLPDKRVVALQVGQVTTGPC